MTSSANPATHKLLLHILNRRSRAQAALSKGFTLIELLVVIVILGVLGAVGYQAYLAQIARANAGVAANTATAMAKNCAALATTGDETDFDTDDFIGDDVTTAGVCTAIGTVSTFSVVVGTGNNVRTATATVRATGAVTPAPVPTA